MPYTSTAVHRGLPDATPWYTVVFWLRNTCSRRPQWRVWSLRMRRPLASSEPPLPFVDARAV